MKRVQPDDLTGKSINPQPTKKRRIRNKHKHKHQKDSGSDNEGIKLIDNYIKSIESMENIQFKQCINTICKDYETKSCEISLQLKQTEIFANNKYEYESEIINNEYIELIDRTKRKLIAKYNEKKCKHERLLKNYFEKHSQKHLKEKCMTNDEKNTYKRPKLIQINNTINTNNINNNQFFDPILQNKWSQMSLVSENDLRNDINYLMFTEPKMRELKIKDILSTFPQCRVTYKSNEHVLEIGTFIGLITNNCFVLKIESLIVIQYEGQGLLYGKVFSISSQDLWCKVRKNGDKLFCIKIQEIEQGTVKIKLIN